MSDATVNWRSPADRYAFLYDLMIHGNAYRRQMPDGLWAHVTVEEFQAMQAQ